MSYVLGGSHGESNAFEKTIAGFALKAVHESTGLVTTTTVVNPTQGDTFVIPSFAPITYQDYNPAATTGSVSGDADEQNPAMTQRSIIATPAVAATAFDVFLGWTTSFPLAAALGEELGQSFGEKVDQRVAASFTSFKASPSNTMITPTPVDGAARPTALGAMELLKSGSTAAAGDTAGFTSFTVLELIRNIKQNWKRSRLPGNPMIILDTDRTMSRLLGELTGGAVNNNLSDLGNELLRTGSISNIYGCSVMFSTFLPTSSRSVRGGAAETVSVGAYYSDQAIYTVLKQDLMIKTGEKPGGLQNWLTGMGFFGSGVADQRRGGAINIELA
jgi:hypothetical protein